MQLPSRLLFAGGALVAALALAGAATAANAPAIHPLLITSNLDPMIATQELIVVVSPSDPPVAQTTMYVGPGDVMTLRPATPFGEADADFRSNATYGSSFFSMGGDVISANPAAYQNNACSPGLHAAVWLARMTLDFLDVMVTIPIYVDPAAPSQSSYASYVLKACMPSPYTDFPQGAIFGGKMIDLQLYLTNFTSAAATNRWTVVAAPFKTNGDPNLPGAAEAQAVTTQGQIGPIAVHRFVKRPLNKHGKRRKLYFAHIHGQVTADGSGVPAQVQIYELYSKDNGPRVATKKASASGSFSATVRMHRSASFGILAVLPGQDVTPAVCSPVLEIGFGPLPCTSVTTSDFFAARVSRKVRIPKGDGGLTASRAASALRARFLADARGRFIP